MEVDFFFSPPCGRKCWTLWSVVQHFRFAFYPGSDALSGPFLFAPVSGKDVKTLDNLPALCYNCLNLPKEAF